ncbi:MAG: HPP family protein [Candidatus Nitrotoga sp.]
MNIKELFSSFKVTVAPIPLSEKIRNGLIGGLAILLLGLALKHFPLSDYPLVMLASIAASAVLLFAAPHSPMAQPWPVLGGHLVSALAGWLCSQLVGDPLLAAGCAVGLAIFMMQYMHCLHPPGAATALTLVLYGTQFNTMGWSWVALVVLANAVISLVFALIVNNILPGRCYPMRHVNQQSTVLMGGQPGFATLEQADIEWALTQMDGVIDVSEEDLVDVYRLATKHAKGLGDKANR